MKYTSTTVHLDLDMDKGHHCSCKFPAIKKLRNMEAFYKAIARVKTTMKALKFFKSTVTKLCLYIDIKVQKIPKVLQMYIPTVIVNILKTIYSQFQTERGSYGDAIKYHILRASVRHNSLLNSSSISDILLRISFSSRIRQLYALAVKKCLFNYLHTILA